jgi:uncharacterized protein (DUF305 family)
MILPRRFASIFAPKLDLEVCMKSPRLAVLLLLATTVPGFAQAQSDHQQHHPGGGAQTGAQAQSPGSGAAAPVAGQPMSGPSQQGSGMGMGMGMMGGCPMMRGMMQGGGMGSMMRGQGPMGASADQSGDQSVTSVSLRAVKDRMQRDMAIPLSGTIDADFARLMIANHEGAIDMAKLAIAFGKDAQVRKIAEETVRTKEAEIATIRSWLATQPKP